MNKNPRLLDLFCGAGGASMGYYKAGFEVVGVDIKPQPHYPFEFHQADAMGYPLEGFDAYHASPPCQGYIHLKRGEPLGGYPLLIEACRQRLTETNKPYSIENVPAAKEYLVNPLRLCGTTFGLPIWKHRYFETYPVIYDLLNTCNHKLGAIDTPFGKIEIPVFCSHGGDSSKGVRPSRQCIRWRPKASKEIQLWAMGIDWGILPRKAINEAIPPAYTEYIGKFLMEAVMEKQKPFTEAEFESLVDKASQPLEPEQTHDSESGKTSESPTSGDCNGTSTHSDKSGDI